MFKYQLIQQAYNQGVFMRKTGVLFILIFFMLAISVSSISKYYSPIVTGQDIENEDGFAGADLLANNLILGTSLSTNHRANFNTCVFSGSGDSDYRYANVDDDGLIYLTDDDFINVFNDDCDLIATHIINGTLTSQPFIFDVEGDGFNNIYYISGEGGDVANNVYQINEIELVNGIFIFYKQTKLAEVNTQGCWGLYCDRDPPFATSSRCLTVCDAPASNVGQYLTIKPFDLTVTGNFSITGNQNGFGAETPYDELNDLFRLDASGVRHFNFYDRTAPAIYGMDIDQDDNLEILLTYPCGASPFDLCVSSVDITEQTLDFTEFLDTNIVSDSNVDFFSSGSFAQTANIGSLNSNGEIFVAYSADIAAGGSGNILFAKVFNSVGSETKEVIDFLTTTFSTHKISNFAVSQVDGDLKNDYCIAFNDTARDNETKIHCYSGLTNFIMTNCTISGWATNNPIHLSLLNWDTTSSMRSEAITTFGIFDLSENSGGECTNLRPGGFTGLTSASEGVMLPVAIGGDFISGSGDTAVDLLYYGADGARLFKTDNVAGETGDPIGVDFCGFAHMLLCDDFDYTDVFTTREWRPFTGQNFNATATPTDNRMFFTNIQRISIDHTIAPSDVVSYRINEVDIFGVSDLHPVVSHEFTINKTSNQTELQYRVFDESFIPSIDVLFKGNSTYFWNESINDYQSICIDCLSPFNSTHRIKIIQFWGRDTFDDRPEIFFPFNVTGDNSRYQVWVDDVRIGDNLLFKDVSSINPKSVFFIKASGFDNTRGVHIDDYFVYRGTAKETDTSEVFSISLFTNVTASCINADNACSISSQCCAGLSCRDNTCQSSETTELITDVEDNAIRQAFRDIPTGNLGFDLIWYLIMFVVGISVFVGVAKTAGGTAALGGTMIVEIFLLIAGTVLGFVPIAIVITIVVIGLVIAGLFLRKMATGSAN